MQYVLLIIYFNSISGRRAIKEDGIIIYQDRKVEWNSNDLDYISIQNSNGKDHKQNETLTIKTTSPSETESTKIRKPRETATRKITSAKETEVIIPNDKRGRQSKGKNPKQNKTKQP